MSDCASTNTGIPKQSHHLSHNQLWRLLLMCALFTLSQSCARTPPAPTGDEMRNQAKIAYLLGDYQRTLAISLPRAEAGEAWAQYTLGYLYYYGRGVVQDRKVAKRWIESAAAKGYAPAQQAMLRLTRPQPRIGDENRGTSRQESAGSKDLMAPPPVPKDRVPSPVPKAIAPQSLVPPAEQEAPINPSPPSQDQGTTPPAPSSEQSTEPSPTPDTNPSPTTEPGQSPQSSPPPSGPIQPQTIIPSSSNEVTSETPPIPSPNKGIKGRNWISHQDPRYFTIQLISSIDKEAVVRFIHEQGIVRQTAYYSTSLRGQTWYSVIYGKFPDAATARQALSRLPRSLRRRSPRIRSFHAIISQINSAATP